jgi:phosphatidylglycerophosphatase GEP4
MPTEQLAMVGDRMFTDIVFGNRYGMLTIHTRVLTTEGDNKAAVKVREREVPLMEKWYKAGIRAPKHSCYRENITTNSLL